MDAGLYLFTGKGGAGKTTCAAALALALASRGHRTRLASLDPAHNLGDVLEAELGGAPREVAPNLTALEVALDVVLEARMAKTRALIERRYRYLTVTAMDPLVGLLGQAPGAEEQAALEALLDLREDTAKTGEHLVVDLPPSGQALRMLHLPRLVWRWCEALLELRRKILARRGPLKDILGEESASRVPEEETCPEDPKSDPVTQALDHELTRHKSLSEDLSPTGPAAINVVTLPARISLIESRRLIKGLAEQGTPAGSLVLNRAAPDFKGTLTPDPTLGPAAVLPDLPDEPRGIESLTELGRRLAPLLP
jgi:arsenite-transporting ATPase